MINSVTKNDNKIFILITNPNPIRIYQPYFLIPYTLFLLSIPPHPSSYAPSLCHAFGIFLFSISLFSIIISPLRGLNNFINHNSLFIVQNSNLLLHIYVGEKHNPSSIAFSEQTGVCSLHIPKSRRDDTIVKDKQRTIFINPERVTFF